MRYIYESHDDDVLNVFLYEIFFIITNKAKNKTFGMIEGMMGHVNAKRKEQKKEKTDK